MEPNNGPAQNTPPTGGKLAFLNDKKKRWAAIIATAIILLSAATASAYYGLILPNQPQNVLKKSVSNLLKKDQISGKGKASFTSGEESGAGTVDYSIQADSTKNTFGGTFDIAYSGVKLPVEVRTVDKAAYLKVGDLGTIESLATAFGGAESGALVQQLSDKVSNKWIEFDESLLKTVTKDSCSILNEQHKLNDQQINQMLDIYSKNMFLTVKNSSNDTVNGQKVVKYELGLDKSKAEQFGKELESIDYFKKLKDCTGETSESKQEENKAEEFKGDASFNVWVDKGKKQFVKMQLNVKEDKTTFDADFTFNNDKVDITKPEGAIPAMQLFSDLSSLFGGAALGASSSTTSTSGSSDINARCSEELLASIQNNTPMSAECEALYGAEL